MPTESWTITYLICFVLSGPIINSQFMDDYATQIRRHTDRGGRYILCSVHFNADRSCAREVFAFMKSHPQSGFGPGMKSHTVRLRTVDAPLYSGVCAASFIGEFYSPARLAVEPYVALSIHEEPEPNLEVVGTDEIVDVEIERRLNRLPWKYARYFDFWNRRPERAGHFKIVRTHHCPGYRYALLTFNQPNTFVSFNPVNYFEIYKNASFTVTNRVHAAVAALALGGAVRYFGNTSRAGIFRRLGLDKSNVMRLSPSVVKSELSYVQDWLRAVVGKLC